MIRTMFRWVVRSTVVAGAVAVVVRLVRKKQEAATPAVKGDPAPVPPPTSVRPAPDEPTAHSDETATAWVPPEDGACPATHPIKAKESSGIFHVPGGMAYDRTTPDRCYRDVAAAQADGYRQAKR